MTIDVPNETVEKLARANEGIKNLKDLFYKIIAYIIALIFYSFIFKIFFPRFMGIIDIQWAEWAVYHSGRFTSWFVVLLVVSLAVRFIVPTINIKIWERKHE
jgi:ABC-type multidrug transport system fused ATPase/permease subunit